MMNNNHELSYGTAISGGSGSVVTRISSSSTISQVQISDDNASSLLQHQQQQQQQPLHPMNQQQFQQMQAMRRFSTPYLENDSMSTSGDDYYNANSQRMTLPHPNNGHYKCNVNNGMRVAQLPPQQMTMMNTAGPSVAMPQRSQPMMIYDRCDIHGSVSNGEFPHASMMPNGYQDYNMHNGRHHSFRDVRHTNNGSMNNSRDMMLVEDATTISELTDVLPLNSSPPLSASVVRAERSIGNASSTIMEGHGLKAECHSSDLTQPSSVVSATMKMAEERGSKIKRSISTRSLSFTESNETEIVSSNESNATEKSANGRNEAFSLNLTKSPMNEESNPKTTSKTSISHITSTEGMNLDDPAIMRLFLMNPCPKGLGMVQCCIRRTKGIKNALFPEYRIYLKANDTFLMTSKKRAGNKTSNYLISMGRNDHDKNSNNIVGKLRSNFLGTEYMIYDNGNNPQYDDAYYEEKGDGNARCELGAILYATSTTLGSKGPRKMKVCIGKVDADGNPLRVWQPINKTDDQMATCFKNKDKKNIEKLVCLENRPPSWNEEVGAYVLNFNGRVSMASVKNFQLVEEADHDGNVTLQFGRTGKDEFSLDVQWPMSPFQAFALALSSCDSKLGCD